MVYSFKLPQAPRVGATLVPEALCDPVQLRPDGRHHGREQHKRPARREDQVDSHQYPGGEGNRGDDREILAKGGEEREGKPIGDSCAGPGKRAWTKTFQRPVEPGEQGDDRQIAYGEPTDRDPHDAQVVGKATVHLKPRLQPGYYGASKKKCARRKRHQQHSQGTGGGDQDDDHRPIEL